MLPAQLDSGGLTLIQASMRTAFQALRVVIMRRRYQAAAICLLATFSMCVDATELVVESARAAREKARADLVRAQEAFDRADEAYIDALGGAARNPRASETRTQGAASARSQVVTFGLSGPRAQISNPLAYRARVIVDGQPGAWTQHASGAKIVVPGEAYMLEYEVQTDAREDMLNPEWRTICAGGLRPKDNNVVDIAIAREIRCSLK